MKRKIRLTESDLHKIVKECARRALNEIGDTPKGQYMLGRTAERARRRDDGATMSLARNKAHWARQGNDKLHKAHEENGELDQYRYQEGAKPTYAEMYESLNRTIKKTVNESIKRVLREIDERELDEDQLEEFEKADEVFARFENGERSHSLLMAADDAAAAFPYEDTKKAQMYIKKLENILNVLDSNNDVYFDAWKNDDVEELEP